MSTSLYTTFGNETSYKILGDTLVAYIEGSTIKFPLPDAGSEILATLYDERFVIRDQVKFEQVKIKLEKAGYKKANANAFAPILMQVAEAQGIDPLDFFSAKGYAIDFTIDAYNAINELRPKGSRVGIAVETTNKQSPAKNLIQP